MQKRVAPLVLISLALASRPAAAEPQANKDEPRASAEIYLTFLPFVEYLDVRGPTVAGFTEQEGHIGVATSIYNELDSAPRFRMTSGTSNVGIRGSYRVMDQIVFVGQMETSMVIDGEPNPWEVGAWPNRNSYAGVGGNWGTLVLGRLDTPYKWSSATTVNPFKGGYVADYTAIIGTPGFLAGSVNLDPYFVTNWFSNAAFFRHEANFLQYWSPNVYGLYFRAGITTNERKSSERRDDMGMPLSYETNPYVASIAGAFDWEGLRLRYAWESHHDYFGMPYISQFLAGVPFPDFPSSNDWGNKAVVDYTFTFTEDLKTRLTGIGEYLIYKVHWKRDAEAEFDRWSGVPYRYARPAFYAQLQQTYAGHNLWGAYGRAFSGACTRVPMSDGSSGGPCLTDNIGAEWLQAGYMYKFTENTAAFVSAYRLRNERSGLYFTAALSREGLSPGLDQLGAGVGLYYTFGASLVD